MNRPLTGCSRSVRCISPSHQDEHEQGITLVMTLILGMLLMAGVSGLLAQQLMSRRLSAKESYQQMAEAAAHNGLNRILAELNNPKPDQYRGFLFTLDNRENLNEPNMGFGWQSLNTSQAPQFSEICLDTSIGLPKPVNSSQGEYWPTTEVALTNANSPSMRDDGISAVETYYRLRGYSSPGTAGSTNSGEAKFIIEGIVRRKNARPESYLARSRLERSLYIRSWVDTQRASDWAVLAAQHFELGPVELQSQGRILWHTSKEDFNRIISRCNNAELVRLLEGTAIHTPDLARRIWPVMEQKQPPITIFKTNGSNDTLAGRPSEIRVWRIDDDNYNPSARCMWRVMCQRSSQSNAYRRQPSINSKRRWRTIDGQRQLTATIRLREQDICAGKTGDCHLYVDRINLERSKLLIENESRPVVIHLLAPKRQSGMSTRDDTASITLGSRALLCGVDANSNTCNRRPERLIIVTDATQPPNRCSSEDHRLNLAGNSLPAAWILMRQGTVSLQSNSQLQGMIWSYSYCSKNHRLKLNAQSQASGTSTLMQQASDLWDWGSKAFSGYGRKITRGIRGTGLDSFQRF